MRRIELIGAAVPLGLITGLAAWLLAGGLSVRANALDDVHGRLAGLRAPGGGASRPFDGGGAALLSSPLFALTTGPGAVREPSIRVDGVSMTRHRMAALISIDARPAEWLLVGESREGVTLQSVTASSATFETPLGVKALDLGDQSAASAPLAGTGGQSEPVATASQDQVPPGFRSPPEPASAPAPH